MSEMASDSENIGPFPIAESMLQAFERKMKPTSEEVAVAREVLETAFGQEAHHIERYRNDAETAAFPYMHLRLSELCDQLLHVPHVEMSMKKLVFTMASARGVKAGHPFIFAEEGLRTVMRKVPAALRGEESGDVAAYTLGAPTNYWGEVSEQFVDDMAEDSFGTLGKLYAEFIGQEIRKYPEAKTVELIGVSMGGNMAMKAAEILLKEGVVRRIDDVHVEGVHGENDIPTLRLKIMSPAGIDTTIVSSVQLPVGFAVDGVAGAFMQPWLLNILRHEKAFFPRIQKLLGWQGFGDDHASDIPLKKRVIRSLMYDLIWKGTKIPEGVKPDILRGTKDASSYSPVFHAKAMLQSMRHGDSLSGPLLSDIKDRREWAINYGHMPPYSSPHEMKRLQAIARALMRQRVALSEDK